jgi:N-acetylglucosaminyl-diphospho-decaprenol L-rhamnosyltransferase
MGNVSLAIVIVTFNTRDLVLQCLHSVTEDAERAGRTYRVIVVDNASTDGTATAVRAAFPSVELMENSTNVGIAPALNQGLKACADCTYALLMNSDIKVLPGTLGPMLDHLDRHPQIAGVSVQLVNPDMSRQKFRTSFGLVLFPERFDRVFQLRFFGDTFHLGRRAIYNEDQVGLFDEFYFFFNEDLDWSVRAHRKGLVFHYLPDLPVVHYSGQGRAQNRLKLLSEFYRMNLYFYAKFYGRAVTRMVYIGQVVSILMRLVHLRLVGKDESGEAIAYRAAFEKQQQFMRTLS